MVFLLLPTSHLSIIVYVPRAVPDIHTISHDDPANNIIVNLCDRFRKRLQRNKVTCPRSQGYE